uniref:Uncharacterized protein n=1 Tax=Nannospalax galili TaxID=1026970 RepID=A0A8C6QW45_NANGA
MAKFLAELLGCTLPSKGASPMLESTIFSTLANEKSLPDCKKEQQRKPAYSNLTALCLTSPLIEKPVGKVRILLCFVKHYDRSLAFISFCLGLFGEIIKSIS